MPFDSLRRGSSRRNTRASRAPREQETAASSDLYTIEESEERDGADASEEQGTAGVNPADPEWQRWIWEEEHLDDPEWRNQRAQAILGGYTLQATRAEQAEQEVLQQQAEAQRQAEAIAAAEGERIHQENSRIAEIITQKLNQNQNLTPQEGEDGYVNSLDEFYQRKARLRGIDPVTGQSVQPAIEQSGRSCFPTMLQAYLTAIGRDTSALANFLMQFPDANTCRTEEAEGISAKSIIDRETNRGAKKYMKDLTRSVPPSRLNRSDARMDIKGSLKILQNLYKQNEWEEVRDELMKIRGGSDVTDEDVSRTLADADHDWDRYRTKKKLVGSKFGNTFINNLSNAFSKEDKQSKGQRALLERINTRRDTFRKRASNNDTVAAGEGLMKLLSRSPTPQEAVSTRRIWILNENDAKKQTDKFINLLQQIGTPAILTTNRMLWLDGNLSDEYQFFESALHTILISGMKKRDGKVYLSIREGNQADEDVAEVEAEPFFAAYTTEAQEIQEQRTGKKQKPMVAQLANVKLQEKDKDRLSKPLQNSDA